MAAIKQAFVLGAGLGKRLRPLTDDLPKPLVPIFHKPLITFALDHLIDI
ncbi:MAG: mannose-1-phosphate guanylyltransferase, partial [Verrucomicrobia bacterium]